MTRYPDNRARLITVGISNRALQALTKGALHGARGGTFSALQGGDFRSGFMGAAAEGALATYIGHWGEANPAAAIAVSAMVSGAASSAVGGNFWDGAEQGAMGYLFNQLGRAFQDYRQMAWMGRRDAAIAQANQAAADYVENNSSVGLGASACAVLCLATGGSQQTGDGSFAKFLFGGVGAGVGVSPTADLLIYQEGVRPDAGAFTHYKEVSGTLFFIGGSMRQYGGSNGAYNTISVHLSIGLEIKAGYGVSK